MKTMRPLGDLKRNLVKLAGESKPHHHLKTPDGQEVALEEEKVFSQNAQHVKTRPKQRTEALEAYTDAVVRNAGVEDIDALRRQAESLGASPDEIDAALVDGRQVAQGYKL